MKQAIDISSISSEKLKRGDYKKLLPEYYALKSVGENNNWHIKPSIFEHVVAVFAGLEKVLKLRFLNNHLRAKIEKYLTKRVDKHTRKDLLVVAIILHDIAKVKVYIKDLSGNTRCPSHEIVSASMVDSFATRFSLDDKELSFVRDLVLYHGFVHDIIGIVSKGAMEDHFALLKEVVGDKQIELLLFIYADMMGSDLRKLNHEEYKNREQVIINSLKTLILSI